MFEQKTKLQYVSRGLLAVLGGVLAAMPAWAVDPFADNTVQMVTYFPTPYVAYNNIYIGKKLDIGVAAHFTANLGSTDCNGKNNLKLLGELPSLWLPATDSSNNAVTPTPLFLRSQSELDISALNAPLYVTNVELGKRDTTGTGTALVLSEPHQTMQNVNMTFTNLVLGQSGVSPNTALETLTVTDNIADPFALQIDGKTINFPSCTDAAGNPMPAHWEQVQFNSQTYTAVVCGGAPKEPFDTQYRCNPNDSGSILRCEVENDRFYCANQNCVPYYRANHQSSQSGYLKAQAHKDYCNWLSGSSNVSPDQRLRKIMVYIMNDLVGSGWEANECVGTPNSSWSTTAPSPSACYLVSSVQHPDSVVSCMDTTSNPNANYTEVPAETLTYKYYTSEMFSEYVDCENYCNNFNN